MQVFLSQMLRKRITWFEIKVNRCQPFVVQFWGRRRRNFSSQRKSFVSLLWTPAWPPHWSRGQAKKSAKQLDDKCPDLPLTGPSRLGTSLGSSDLYLFTQLAKCTLIMFCNNCFCKGKLLLPWCHRCLAFLEFFKHLSFVIIPATCREILQICTEKRI